MKKKVLVIGASENPARYSNMAIKMLNEYEHDVLAFGLRQGKVDDTRIMQEWSYVQNNIDTVTLYVGPQHQEEYYKKLVALNPKRVIFNPGTENAEFQELLETAGIETLEACTLVMLRTGQF